jgi:Flp pilus assembly protein CpaB
MSMIKNKKAGFEGRKLWFFFAAVAALLTAVVLFIILSQVTSTSKYYVLKEDVAARTQITEDMLQEVVTSTNGEPQNALDLAEIVTEPVYAKYPLNAGDILTASNTGPLNPIEEGIPEDFVVATFNAPASFAAGGKIQRGDYVDLIVVQDDTASYFLQHVLVLDATINLDNASASSTVNADGSTTNAADSSAVRSGIPTLYTVGLSPQDAAKLAIASQATIYVVLSANQTSDPVPPMEITVDLGSLNGLITDSGAGTDNTFSGKAKKSSTSGTSSSNSSSNSSTPSPSPTEDVVVEEELVPVN